MSKRKYTHIKELLPTIQTMVEGGMIQRVIAEHFSFKNKFVLKEALKCARRKAITILKTRGRKSLLIFCDIMYQAICSIKRPFKIENAILNNYLHLYFSELTLAVLSFVEILQNNYYYIEKSPKSERI